MKSLFQQALENIDNGVQESDASVLIKGPLSNIYAQALDIAYAKPVDENGMVMESQQMDVTMMQRLAASLSKDPAPTDNFQTVYGVSRDAITDEVVVDITKEVAQSALNAMDFILIIDATQPGANGVGSSAPQQLLRNLVAVEALVEAHGGRIFSSLENFAKSR